MTNIGKHKITGTEGKTEPQLDMDMLSPQFIEMKDRHSLVLDENRPEAVRRRHQNDQRTARENIEDLMDAGSFMEYGALAVAAQRRRRSIEDLMSNTPADGIITGIGSINSLEFGDKNSRCMVLAYDYTVLAGTQGFFGHK